MRKYALCGPRLSVDINTTLQETRLAGCGTLKEKHYLFYRQKRSSNQPRVDEVGFALRNSLLSMVELCSDSLEQLMALHFNTTSSPVNLVTVYAPTLSATQDTIYIYILTNQSTLCRYKAE